MPTISGTGITTPFLKAVNSHNIIYRSDGTGKIIYIKLIIIGRDFYVKYNNGGFSKSRYHE